MTALSVTRDGATTGGTYTYDASGNPTGYFNPGDLAAWTMTWRNGRELAIATKTGTAVSYDYDVNGLRTEKTVNGVTHTYLYASGKLLRDEWTENDTACCMDFFYDYAGNPYVVFFSRGAEHQRFYYLTNLQGDVIGILNTSAQLVAEYDYDPYGNLISYTGTTTGAEIQQAVGQANPLRYRGYYFDQETGFYYLQSRYYDPALGRFLNADSYASTGQSFLGYNMFGYCNNNPTTSEDPSGSIPTFSIMVTDSYIDNPNGNPYAYVVHSGSGGIVLDVSYAAGKGGYVKAGVSLVVEPEHENTGLYFHVGYGIGTSKGPSASYGYVKHYKTTEDYKGVFVDAFANAYLGGDYCYAPGRKTNQIKAYSVTGGKGINLGVGVDYYFTIGDLLSGKLFRDIINGIFEQQRRQVDEDTL